MLSTRPTLSQTFLSAQSALSFYLCRLILRGMEASRCLVFNVFFFLFVCCDAIQKNRSLFFYLFIYFFFIFQFDIVSPFEKFKGKVSIFFPRGVFHLILCFEKNCSFFDFLLIRYIVSSFLKL